MRKTAKIVRLSIFSLLGLISAVIFGELFLRFFHPYPSVTFFNSSYTFDCFTKSPFYWAALLPNKTCPLTSNLDAFPDTVVQTNSLGLRSDEPELPKPEGSTRLLFVGDSFTFGWGIHQDKTYPEKTLDKIEQRENLSEYDFDMINGSLTGSGPSYYYLFTKNHPELSPDVVIIGTYMYNDIIGLKDTVWIDVDEHGYPNKAESNHSYVDEDGILRSKEVPWIFRAPVLNSSQLFGLFADKFLQPKKVGVSDTTIKLICLFQENCHETDEIRARNRKMMEGIKKITDERGQKLLVVMIPAELQVYEGRRFKYGIPLALSPEAKSLPNRRLATYLDELGVEHLDLLPLMRANNNTDFYFKLDDHWNETAHEFAAEEISKKIEEMLLQKDAGSSGSIEKNAQQ